ncbi:DUF1801 domain-containing protein [Flavobacterium sp. KACC 22761]|uniref:DUF1801 domain-containing protein n=1 Tax=Flavobacterium sp. KACC 22761 TaxID=3092665 RepID=UPI002A7535D9|nr:DUF1801 domain-containing protein [Flavobacterium sp. KACC 22761]WPO78780.1 DUF1801 domain-containing protein [Flavobacterium sp. KACC 22761]
MAKNKTSETESSVIDFINAVEDETKRNDAFELVKIMQKTTGFEAKMWGPSIIGFGSYHYKYASGHEGDAPLAAFSPRKAAISLYFSLSPENREKLLAKFGKFKPSKGCIYVKKLADIDLDVLKEMTLLSVENLTKQYPS